MSAYEELLEFISELKIIDTHEHLPNEADRPKQNDVLAEYLMHYMSSDVVSAGLSDEALARARDSSGDLLERWGLVEPYWEAARSTGYGRGLDLSAEGLYGIPGVHRDTIAPLNEAFLAAREKGGHYRFVLKEKCRIALSITDDAAVGTRFNCDPEFFVATLHIDDFIAPADAEQLGALAARVGVAVHSFGDTKRAVELWIDEAFGNERVVTMKLGLAYHRTLQFEKVSEAAAAEDFNRFFFGKQSPGCGNRPGLGKAYQDHMMHHICRLADERGLPMQIHTGIQEGNGNVIANSNPTLLTNLFMEYGGVKFDIFHMAYPYVMELGNLAKNFRNVFIDMCWGHMISPEAARRALVEWLDAVPANKINAFGGDYCFVDGVYGHQVIARQNVAASLAQKVSDGSFDLDRAKQIARWLFVDNPTRIFNLAGRLDL